MHHLLIGEGQIGQAIARHAAARGDTLTILRRSTVTADQKHTRYGDVAHAITHVPGDVLDAQALRRAAHGAEAILACFHAPYDARIWKTELPPREQAVLDLADDLDIPVVFPESMYAFQGQAAHLAEGARPTPSDPKGRIRAELMEARRHHGASTLSIIASDFVGPTTRGTGTAVATALVVEPLLAGRPVIVPADPEAPHSLTHLPDLAEAMVFAAREATTLTAGAPGRSVVLHAPTGAAHSMRELAALTAQLTGVRQRRVVAVPRRLTALLGRVSTLMRELSGIADIWYGPCVLEPGVLTTVHGLEPTPWAEAIAATITPPSLATDEPAAADTPDARG